MGININDLNAPLLLENGSEANNLRELSGRELKITGGAGSFFVPQPVFLFRPVVLNPGFSGGNNIEININNNVSSNATATATVTQPAPEPEPQPDPHPEPQPDPH